MSEIDQERLTDRGWNCTAGVVVEYDNVFRLDTLVNKVIAGRDVQNSGCDPEDVTITTPSCKAASAPNQCCLTTDLSIHSSPNITRNGCKEPNKAGTPRIDARFVNITSPPKSPTATISMLCSLKPSLLPHPAAARPQALSKLHCKNLLRSI